MTVIRFYLDEDTTSKRLLQALRNRGADVVSIFEVGMLAQSDEHQLEWALKNQRVITPNTVPPSTKCCALRYTSLRTPNSL
ncbi:MAG: hypothetical protein EA365_11500 [Gloeocapsa sp. DLM2.Bin57]|nr:MAG: hypothetical protein EA365_11500 [Gloeocapsa sp. DLM2.Bin57]